MSTHGYMVQPSLASSSLRRGSEGAATLSTLSSSNNNPRPTSAQPQTRQPLSNRPGSAPEQNHRHINPQQAHQPHHNQTKASLYQSASGLKGGVIANVYSRKAARSVTSSSSTTTSSSLHPHPPSSLSQISRGTDNIRRPMSANSNTNPSGSAGAITRLLERFSQSRSSGGGAGGVGGVNPLDLTRNKTSNGANLLTADPSALEKQGTAKGGLLRSQSMPSAGLTPTLHSASPLAAVTSVPSSLDRYSVPLIADRGASAETLKPTPVMTIGRTSAPAAPAPPSQPQQGQPLFFRRTQHLTPTNITASSAASATSTQTPNSQLPSQEASHSTMPSSPFITTEEASPTTKSSLGLKAGSLSSSSPPVTPTPLFSPPSPSQSSPNGLTSPQSPFRSLMIRIPGEASEQAALRQIPLISELPMSSVTPSAHHQKQIKKPAMSMGHPSCECMNDLLAVSGDLSSDFGLTDEWLGFVINQLRYKQLLKSIESRRHST